MKPKEQALSSLALILAFTAPCAVLLGQVTAPAGSETTTMREPHRPSPTLLPAGKSHPIQQSQSIGVFWLARTHFSLSSKNTGRTFATRF